MAKSTPQQCARSVVAYAVAKGQLPRPDSIACVDCGLPGKEYDHFMGYDRAHQRSVQPVCVKCHAKRKVARGEMPRGAEHWMHGKKIGRKLSFHKHPVIRDLYGIGFLQRELAAMYGVTQMRISQIVRGVDGN